MDLITWIGNVQLQEWFLSIAVQATSNLTVRLCLRHAENVPLKKESWTSTRYFFPFIHTSAHAQDYFSQLSLYSPQL